jgi:hypothetical protein
VQRLAFICMQSMTMSAPSLAHSSTVGVYQLSQAGSMVDGHMRDNPRPKLQHMWASAAVLS